MCRNVTGGDLYTFFKLCVYVEDVIIIPVHGIHGGDLLIFPIPSSDILWGFRNPLYFIGMVCVLAYLVSSAIGYCLVNTSGDFLYIILIFVEKYIFFEIRGY